MALRCLSSIKANNKIIYLTQFNQATMSAIWDTNRNDYAWYTDTSRPPIAPDQYVTSYGTDIMTDFYDNTWLSSGDENYNIENTEGSYMLKAYNSTVGPRNIVGISPYGYGPNDIWIRYPQNEISFFTLNIGIIIDDDNRQAVIVLRNRRYDPDNSVSPFDRLTLYSATTTRQTFYEAFYGAEPPQYTWQSVPNISSKNGILSLSVIKDELLGDLTGGTWQSVSEVMDALTPNSRLYKYWNNLATGQEVTMCYSGDNYLNIKRDTASSCELKFYFRSGVLIYSTGVNMSTLGRDPYLAMVIDEENHVVQVIIVYELDVQGSKQITWYGLNPSDTEMSALYSWLVYGEPDTPNNPYAQGTTANGGDDFNLTPQDDFSDELPPDITGLDCGFFTVYVPTSGQLQSLASFLWSDDIIDNIKKYFGNVSDSIISLYMLPYKPRGLSTKKFQVGDIVLDDGPSVEFLSGQRYVDVDMGSFSIDPTFNSYLDYEPFTKLSIYLPFIGVQQLPTDEFMTKADPSGALSDKSGSTISVKYRIDLLTGGCVAYIKQGTQNKLQFSGKCGATLPISGANYNNMISGLVQAVGGLASTIASGGLTAPLSFGAAISGTVSAMKPDLYKAGNLSGELSLLSYNRPMIIKTRPNIHKDMSEQIDVDGLPSYKVKTIGDYNGYISCVAVHVDGINCTDAEKEKIHSLLLEGVIV